jgi:hypothetical protein
MVTLRYVVDTATAIGRAFGRERPGLLDVLHSLADVRTPTGARLAATGLTEEAIVSWRRAGSVGTPPPLLTVEVVAVTPDVERLLDSVLEGGPILNLDRARGLVGAELLNLCDADEADLDSLLDSFAIDRPRLAAELARSDEDRASFPFPRPYRGLSVFARPEHLVIVPTGRGNAGFSRELQSLATYTDPDVPVAELGDRVLIGFGRYGTPEDPFAQPFWKGLGFRTETAFLRRARLVMATELDFSVHFSPTAHLGPKRYDVMSTRTPTYAPIDDSASIGSALKAAIQGSQG